MSINKSVYNSSKNKSHKSGNNPNVHQLMNGINKLWYILKRILLCHKRLLFYSMDKPRKYDSSKRSYSQLSMIAHVSYTSSRPAWAIWDSLSKNQPTNWTNKNVQELSIEDTFKTTLKDWIRWHTPVVPTTRKTEARGSLRSKTRQYS